MITAYDLSEESDGKWFRICRGITASGFSVNGMTWREAKTVAVDPRVIPLGTKLLINFNDNKFKKYNGVYVARDTGGAIKGNKIDFFLGDFGGISPRETSDFGIQKAKVYILGGKK